MARQEKVAVRGRGEATRADIVAAGRRLFSEHGYHATGLADIQEATGLTKGAFYHHFRSKEELALAVLGQAEADYRKHCFEPVAGRSTPGERIEALLDRLVELNARPEWCNCQLLATLCAELTTADARLREAVQRMQIGFFECWRDLLAQAQAAGQVKAEIDASVAAQWIMSTLLGQVLSRKIGVARVPAEVIIRLVKGALLVGSGTGR